ncbi:hypothetical protein E2C01_004707 [Portunus trituberculatus]|uniref:Uncharacterized protein n=1 Tax=Portunus trituberculatus TaxID=210409 RepID=A0A5B7CR92_PORTR|nr:hypothetical protein [Portunus trituberculatus]
MVTAYLELNRKRLVGETPCSLKLRSSESLGRSWQAAAGCSRLWIWRFLQCLVHLPITEWRRDPLLFMRRCSAASDPRRAL